MTWLTEIQDAAALRSRAARSLSLQVGLANPLWLAYGAAASAGAAWFMMTRWGRPVNLEADLAPAAPVEIAEAAIAALPVEVEVEVEQVAEALAEPAAAVEADVHAFVEAEAEAQPAPEIEPAPEAAPASPDDLTALVGVGPRTAAALAERGVTRFADLAAWTTEQLAAFDAELKLKGRGLRDDWIGQAQRLAAGD